MSYLGRIKGTANELIDSVLNALKVSLNDGYGNPIGSLKGAIDVHDADPHSIPINENFHRHTGVSTTLTVDSLAGATSITVASVVGFATGDNIQIEDGVIETTFPRITNIVGNVITLDRPLDNPFLIGDLVDQIQTNMNVIGTLAAPVSFKIIPDLNQTWHIVGFTIAMLHTTEGDHSKFGNLTALTNGVILRVYNGTLGKYRTFTNWKSNADISLDTGGISYYVKTGGGLYGESAEGLIKFRSGAVPSISGANGDFIEILVQDNLSTLTSFNIKAQGHVVGL